MSNKVNANSVFSIIKGSRAKEMPVDRSRMRSGTGPVRKRYFPPFNTMIINKLPKHPNSGRFMAPKDREDRNKNIPKAFSWKNKPGIAKPFDQKICGSCWAVSMEELLII